jgi:hypothetical protein
MWDGLLQPHDLAPPRRCFLGALGRSRPTTLAMSSPPSPAGPLCSYYSAAIKASQGADLLRLPSPRYPLHRTPSRHRVFGATIRRHRLPSVAVGCKTGLDKPIRLLTVAHDCCVLRPEWCQQWCQTVSPTTTVVRLVAPSTSSGAATLFGIQSAQSRLPPRHHERKGFYSTPSQGVHT